MVYGLIQATACTPTAHLSANSMPTILFSIQHSHQNHSSRQSMDPNITNGKATGDVGALMHACALTLLRGEFGHLVDVLTGVS